MMRSQFQLVVLLAVIAACIANANPSQNSNLKEVLKDDEKTTLKRAQDPRYNKMINLPPKGNSLDGAASTKKNSKSSLEKSSALKDDSTFAPVKNNKIDGELLDDIQHADVGKDDIQHTADSNKDEIDYEEYYDENGDEFSEEDDDEEETQSENETKPISANKTDKKAEDEELIEDDYEEGEEDADEELEEDGMNIDINKVDEMKQCPRDCICERNMHAYFVATCSRLDLETQSFANLPITDLQVIDIGPQFPIVLGVEFFKKIGLANVTSIKIANSSIEYISPSAFNGLNELYSINLTSIGIDLIHPDTFANNTKLKILTLSGNNLNVMQSLSSPYTDYMLKSPSIEELDISNCNMQEFLPSAFSQMKNIIYINLAGNQLTTLPEGLFDKTDTIEELDLSYNKIATLPKNIFNKTSLAILHLKYNEIVSNLQFVTKDVQKLDISFNKMTSVNNQMFKNLENLSFLSLKGNKIKRINPGAFVSLKSLRHIDLSFNDLDQINSLTFLKNPDLEVIRINDNIHLKSLPTDGFVTNEKAFHVFLFDASNCDLSNLGENTFKTMPFITRLYLSGNNIENIPRNLFSPSLRLMELDLSNNLIASLDAQVFASNNDLQKLNLAANPMETLSTKIFHSTPYLQELDISDCDLVSLWQDSSKNARDGDLLKTLKVLNISNNDIRNVFTSDLSTMRNLKVFDLKNNPLDCNDDFKNLMKFLGTRKISLGNHNNHGELEEMKATFFEEMSPAIEWNELARKICRRNEENKLNNQQVLEEIDDETEDDDYDDDDDDDEDEDDDEPIEMEDAVKLPTKKPITVTKAPKDKTPAPKKTVSTAAPSVVDSNNNNNNENDGSTADDDYDYNENDDDEDEEREDESIVEDKPDKDILFDGIQVIKKVENRIFGGTNIDEEEEEEVVIEAATISQQYRFLWPMLIVMFSIFVVLVIIMFTIASCMRRRGERYRQALLQSSKNSIIYQKLSEEIHTPQTPKVHRYTPIAQV